MMITILVIIITIRVIVILTLVLTVTVTVLIRTITTTVTTLKETMVINGKLNRNGYRSISQKKRQFPSLFLTGGKIPLILLKKLKIPIKN